MTKPPDLPEPPDEAPGVRLLAIDGDRETVRDGESVLVRWGADRSRDIRRIDGPFSWPTPLSVHTETKAIVRFDTPAPPTLIEITAFDRVDENGHPAGERAHFKCENVPLFEDAPLCRLSHVVRDGASGWELPLPVPDEPGLYYLSVWAQWVAPRVPGSTRPSWARPRGVFLGGWPFVIECFA